MADIAVSIDIIPAKRTQKYLETWLVKPRKDTINGDLQPLGGTRRHVQNRANEEGDDTASGINKSLLSREIQEKRMNFYTTAEGVVGRALMTSSSFLAFGVMTIERLSVYVLYHPIATTTYQSSSPARLGSTASCSQRAQRLCNL
jgi:hypothetical protein